MNTADVINYIL